MPMNSLSTCHQELVVLDGNLVKSSSPKVSRSCLAIIYNMLIRPTAYRRLKCNSGIFHCNINVGLTVMICLTTHVIMRPISHLLQARATCLQLLMTVDDESCRCSATSSVPRRVNTLLQYYSAMQAGSIKYLGQYYLLCFLQHNIHAVH